MTNQHDRQTTDPLGSAIERLRLINAQDLENLGIDDIAYVKPVVVQDQTLYSVHAADGKSLGVLPGRDVAFAAVIQQGLDPVSVH